MFRRPRTGKSIDLAVVGVGGIGIDAIDRMATEAIPGANFVAVDADIDRLCATKAAMTIRARDSAPTDSLTKGLGHGLIAADIVFVVAGLGETVGAQLAPVVAKIAREEGALVISLVTLPFSFGGRNRAAADSLRRMQRWANTSIILPAGRLLMLAAEQPEFQVPFRLADPLWVHAVQCVAEVANLPGIVDVNFSDVKAIIEKGGPSVVAWGEGQGQRRAAEAADAAAYSHILDAKIDGARGLLITVSGGADLALPEVREIVAPIARRADPKATICFGATVDDSLRGRVCMTIFATGLE